MNDAVDSQKTIDYRKDISNSSVKISIAMATYNGFDFLPAQIESLATQTLLPDELVIYDDCSTDETCRLIDHYSDKVPFTVKVLRGENNVGVSLAFQAAIASCTGEIIFFCDQDDVWMSEKIESHIRIYESHPDCGYVFSDAEITDFSLQNTGKYLFSTIGFNGGRYQAYVEGKQIAVMLQGGNFVYGNTMSFKSKYNDILFPYFSESPQFTHDVWVSHVLSSIGAYGIVLPGVMVKYRQHTSNQAGAGKKVPFLDKVKRIRCRRRDEVKPLIKVYGDICERVQRCHNEKNSREVWELGEKILHLNVRGNLVENSGLKRLLELFFEFQSGRYHKFSGGYKSFIRDLVYTEK